MVSKPPDWQLGDAVYALRVDPRTQRYVVTGVGRVIRIEGGNLVLATKTGTRAWGRTEWPAFKSREEGEAYCVDRPGPGRDSRPVAHYGADDTAPRPEPQWECLRCERIRAGREPLAEAPDHTPRCPFRGTGRDPERDG